VPVQVEPFPGGLPAHRRGASLSSSEPERDPRLLFSIRHNLVDALTKAGRYQEGRDLLPQVRSLARRFALLQTAASMEAATAEISRKIAAFVAHDLGPSADLR
jgi:hypothetical protein